MTFSFKKETNSYKVIFLLINQNNKINFNENYHKNRSLSFKFFMNFISLTFIFLLKVSEKITNSQSLLIMPLKKSLPKVTSLHQFFFNIALLVDRQVLSSITNKKLLCCFKKSPPKINSSHYMSINSSKKSKPIK